MSGRVGCMEQSEGGWKLDMWWLCKVGVLIVFLFSLLARESAGGGRYVLTKRLRIAINGMGEDDC